MFLMIPNLAVQVKDVMKDVMAGLQQTNSEKILLSWVRQNTRQYPQVSSLPWNGQIKAILEESFWFSKSGLARYRYLQELRACFWSQLLINHLKFQSKIQKD